MNIIICNNNTTSKTIITLKYTKCLVLFFSVKISLQSVAALRIKKDIPGRINDNVRYLDEE